MAAKTAKQPRRGIVAAIAVGLFAVGCATGTFDFSRYDQPTIQSEPMAEAGALGKVQGVVRNDKRGEKVDDALVVLDCPCLSGWRETKTNADGIFKFTDLPPGEYRVQVLTGQADVTRSTTLKAGYQTRIDFNIDPYYEFKRT